MGYIVGVSSPNIHYPYVANATLCSNTVDGYEGM